MLILFLVRFWVAEWLILEKAAHSVIHMFSLYGFEGWIRVLIASVPGLCIFYTCFHIVEIPGLMFSFSYIL